MIKNLLTAVDGVLINFLPSAVDRVLINYNAITSRGILLKCLLSTVNEVLINYLLSAVHIQGVSEKNNPSKRPLFYKVTNIISVKMLHI